MAKYDGWTLKTKAGKEWHLCIAFCHETRKQVIDHFESLGSTGRGSWLKFRLAGIHRIVKVKLMEIR